MIVTSKFKPETVTVEEFIINYRSINLVSIPAGGPTVGEFFSIVLGVKFDMSMISN